VFFYFVSTSMFLMGPLDRWVTWFRLSEGANLNCERFPAARSFAGFSLALCHVLQARQAVATAPISNLAPLTSASCHSVDRCLSCNASPTRHPLIRAYLVGPMQKIAWNVLRPGLLITMLAVMAVGHYLWLFYLEPRCAAQKKARSASEPGM
jgi:hypothetical protein